MTLVSVIIPVFNEEKTIERTIRSVLAQTFSEFELIIINDGSTDSSLETISSIKDRRLKVFSYENSGVAESRNRGITQATGEYITFLDADDLWTEDKLEAQLFALKNNCQASVAYSWTNYIDEYDQFLHRGSHATYNGNVYEELFVSYFLENGSNSLIRTQTLAVVGGFNKSLSPAEDWDFYLRLAERYQFVCVPTVQILYRVSNNSASSNILRMEKAGLQVLNRALSCSPEALQALKKKSSIEFYKYLIYRCFEVFQDKQKSFSTISILLQGVQTDSPLLKRIGKRGMFTIWSKLLWYGVSFHLKLAIKQQKWYRNNPFSR